MLRPKKPEEVQEEEYEDDGVEEVQQPAPRQVPQPKQVEKPKKEITKEEIVDMIKGNIQRAYELMSYLP